MQYLKLPSDELKDLFSDNDKETMYVYTFLNFNAVYKEQTIKIKSKIIKLEIGQFAISERLLGKILKIEKSKIRRIILSLKEKGIIETITSDSCTIFSINSKVIRTTTKQKRLFYLKTMPYRQYLETDEWKLKRKEALIRANFKCQLCNQSGALNVHHRTYERRGNELTKDLIVLCSKCHSKFHDILKE